MSADSIPARMAELNKTLEHLNQLFDLAGNVTAGPVATEARCVASEIRRLSNLPLPVITSCSTCHPPAVPHSEIRIPNSPQP